MCSTEIGSEQNKDKMTSWFVKSKYSKKLIHSKTRTVKFDTGETNKKNKRENGIAFVMACHSRLNYLHSIIRKSIYLVNIT